MIYLDHNATSPARPQVIEALLPYLAERAGNPASVHGPGRLARQGLDEARRKVGALLGVHESRVIFTSGGTEANNLALFGQTARSGFRGHLVTSVVEHPSVLRSCEVLEQRGMTVSRLPVDGLGRVDPADVDAAIQGDTVLVSIMHANNETGVIQPIERIAAICRRSGVLFHSDRAQTIGKWPLGLQYPGQQPGENPAAEPDMVSLSAHKFGGPKGTGALVVSNAIAMEPQLVGGGQERGHRSGTENLPGIVGFGAAAEQVMAEAAVESQAMATYRDFLETRLAEALPACVVFGQGADRLPNTTAVGCPGLDGETLVMNLDLAGFAVSSGSACSSGRAEPSPVPRAMGVSETLARSMVRISLGWNTRREEVERFAAAYIRTVKKLLRMVSTLAIAV